MSLDLEGWRYEHVMFIARSPPVSPAKWLPSKVKEPLISVRFRGINDSKRPQACFQKHSQSYRSCGLLSGNSNWCAPNLPQMVATGNLSLFQSQHFLSCSAFRFYFHKHGLHSMFEGVILGQGTPLKKHLSAVKFVWGLPTANRAKLPF